MLLAFACWRLSGCAVFVCVPRKFRLAFRRPKCESVAGRIADSTYARLSLSAVVVTFRALHSLRLAYRFMMPGDWLSHTASLGHPLNTPATFSVRLRISATARANMSQSLQRAVRRSADFVRRAAILRGAFAGSTTPLLSLHSARRKADAEKQRALARCPAGKAKERRDSVPEGTEQSRTRQICRRQNLDARRLCLCRFFLPEKKLLYKKLVKW